jgi:hypothetical protein
VSRGEAPAAPRPNTYAFRGAVWYGAARGAKERLVTTIRIDAPSRAIAQAILDNYGMEAPKPVREQG